MFLSAKLQNVHRDSINKMMLTFFFCFPTISTPLSNYSIYFNAHLGPLLQKLEMNKPPGLLPLNALFLQMHLICAFQNKSSTFQSLLLEKWQMPIPHHTRFVTAHIGGTISLSGKTTKYDALLPVCWKDVIFCRRMKCCRLITQALHHLLSLCTQKTSQEHNSTQSIFFFSSFTAVPFPPLSTAL